MRFVRPLATGAAALACLATAVLAPASDAATPAYTVRTLHFAVTTGPTGAQKCDIVGDLYTPTAASSAHRVPAILTTNGFGGSKDDQAGIGKAFAARGYEVLSYSGLGFGGSGCKITLDDPDYDGRAGSQLISYLGGAPGIAFTDAAHTAAAPVLNVVVHDAVDHAGKRQTYDPRVGMVGGSYGGQIQFAVADVDPRLDTIVPIITWNDLSYSLAPNNTALSTGVSSATPGAVKLNWAAGFSALGVANGVQNAPGDPSRLVGCPNFADFVCPALVSGAAAGYLQPDAIASLKHASVATYLPRITIPTLLMQGENDTLFNLNEAVATYKALLKQGTPVKMVWQSWGHSQSTPAPGELDLSAPDPNTQYETARISAWFDHYLKGTSASTGPNFAYFRPWVSYTGIATPAYATATTPDPARSSTLYLSGDGTLASSAASVSTAGTSFVTPPAGLPTSLDPLDVLGSYTGTLTETDLPGTAATWTTPALTSNVDVAGSPTVTVQVLAPTAALTQATGAGGQLVLFVKVEDVDASGTATLINGDIAPIRVPDVTRPITVSVPALVHRFAAGHSIRLVIAGGSANYRGGLLPVPVTVPGGSFQTLKLPLAG